MTILSGFEAEFDPMREAFLGEMREKVDYMILGQHFVNRGLNKTPTTNNPNYPIEYANMISQAIDSGIFDIIAHPDIFMELRDTMETDEAKELFDRNASIASQIICEKARDMGIPIEINLSNDKSYPNPTFWNVAKDIEGLKVLKGIDAHSLESFKSAIKSEELISDIEKMVSDKMITGTYNPVIERKNNPKLQEAYANGQASALTFETHVISQLVNNSLEKAPNELDTENLAMVVATSLNNTMQDCVDNASKKDSNTMETITQISNSELNLSDKKGKLERKKLVIQETNQILSNQQKAIENSKETFLTAMNMGCSDKQEYSNTITQITQHKTTTNEQQKIQIESHLSSFQESKGISVAKDKTYQLTRKNPTQSNISDSNKGFVNVIILSLVVTFVIGFAIGIGYMLYRFTTGG